MQLRTNPKKTFLGSLLNLQNNGFCHKFIFHQSFTEIERIYAVEKNEGANESKVKVRYCSRELKESSNIGKSWSSKSKKIYI